ncbi:MAG: efflux RND transporter permease subunit, partial [Opitutaceae bacterium]
IQTRIEMLATGIRSQIGIKVLGPDLAQIQKTAEQIEALLKQQPNTATAFAERVTGGYYVDFKVDRDAIARYGLTVEDVQAVIESAVGGKNIGWSIEGRERFPINVRYARDFRSDLPALRRVLVATPTGAQIPLGELADIRRNTGPPAIRNENGMLAGFVYVDTHGIDLGSYVAQARQLIAEHVKLPPGYYLEWGGQYQYLLKAREKLALIVPLTLLIIFVLLFLNFRNLTEACIVLLSIPFALVGGVWLLYLLGYNYSVAVVVGFIALAGVAAETGVVMIVYLDESWHHLKQAVARPALRDLYDAVMEGAVQRVRPKMMTVSAIIGGLLPIMWSHGTGADTMKRIAAPMVGGMVSSTILTLLIIPAIYHLWRSREIARDDRATRPGKRRAGLVVGFIIGALILGGAIFGWREWMQPRQLQPGGLDTSVLTQSVGVYEVRITSADGAIAARPTPIRLAVVDASTGQPVDVESVTFGLRMDMPGMPMAADAVLQKSDQPGVFTGTIRPTMAGEYAATIRVRGRAGDATQSVSLVVRE